LPKWDASSPAAIIQATIVVGMLQLAEQQDIPQTARTMLAEDNHDFVSARALLLKEED
jgi:hypothetical protein